MVSSDAKGERDKAWESLCRAEGWVCRICGGVPERGQHFTDNLSLGLDLSRVFRQLTGRLPFRVVERDVCHPIECGAVDDVFHFASPASPVD